MCVCCRYLQACAAQDIVPSPSGVVITSQEKVFTVKAYAKVYVPLRSPVEAVFRHWDIALRRLMATVNQAAMQPGHRSVLNEVLERLNTQMRNYDYGFVNSAPARTKRGLFNFIGDAASALFGIPSASDIQALRDANEQIAKTCLLYTSDAADDSVYV